MPKSLIVARYFAKEQEVITKREAELESITAQLTEMEEEHGGEDGTLSALDKVNKANVIARIKELKVERGELKVENGELIVKSGKLKVENGELIEEKVVLEEWLELNNREAELKRVLKDAEAALDAKAYAQYPKLTEAEIKTLVVDDKWLAALDAAIHGEMDRISQALTQRVKELAERYETPMPQMVSRVAELEKRVTSHLERMGFQP